VTLIPAKAFVLGKPVEVQVGSRAHSGLHDAFGRLITGDSQGTPDADTEANAIFNRGQ